jgi:DNA invertase Pin-like site-specific DNA recombinase
MVGLRAGDVVVVTKLDRLGRSTRELLDLIDRISKAGTSFRSLGDPLWVTSSARGRPAALPAKRWPQSPRATASHLAMISRL